MDSSFSKTLGQLVRYFFVGIATNLIGYLIYLMLTAFVLPPKLTMTILYASGAIIGFFGNRHFTFRHKGGARRAAIAYTVVHIGGWAINFAMLSLFFDRLGYPHQIVQAVSIFVVAAYLFVAMRLFVFPEREGSGKVAQ